MFNSRHRRFHLFGRVDGVSSQFFSVFVGKTDSLPASKWNSYCYYLLLLFTAYSSEIGEILYSFKFLKCVMKRQST